MYEYVESAGLTGGALKLLVTAENRLFLKAGRTPIRKRIMKKVLPWILPGPDEMKARL